MMSAPQDDNTIQDILALFSTDFDALQDSMFLNCLLTAFSKKKKWFDSTYIPLQNFSVVLNLWNMLFQQSETRNHISVTCGN